MRNEGVGNGLSADSKFRTLPSGIFWSLTDIDLNFGVVTVAKKCVLGLEADVEAVFVGY